MATSKYTLLIICEGKNTEPHFFSSLRDEILNQTYEIGDIAITIHPEPDQGTDDDIQSSPHKAPRKKITTRKASSGVEPKEIVGVPPLKWVLAGQEELESGTFDEVWVVFDHDNHPARKEAFEKAEEEINGKKIHIAFSSRSFEYYLLLNFERIFYHFEKTECKTEGKRKKPIDCGNGTNEKDCMGITCINGYARIKGYWSASKGNTSIFPLIKDKLETGFENSLWLRSQSEKTENMFPVYERNPYITSDNIVKRLTGFSWEWIEKKETDEINGIQLYIGDDKKIKIRNYSQITIVIQSNWIAKISLDQTKNEIFGERIVLFPPNTNGHKHEEVINLETKLNDCAYFIFTYGKYKRMFAL